MLGAAIGLAITTALAALHGWTPIIRRPVEALAPLAGVRTGMLAGTDPVWRAK